MLDYFKGVMFLIFFVFLLSNLGNKILKSKYFFVYNLLVGYVIYCVLQFFGGFIAHFLPNSWLFYKIYMILMIVLISFVSFKKMDIKNVINYLYLHLKKYCIFYVLAGILLIFNIFNIEYLWIGNHIDDGYYLMKVATASSYNSFNINPPSGLATSFDFVRAINTYELDYAFWVNLLGIYPSVFCKFIITYFNYFIYILSFFSVYCIFTRKDENSITWKDTLVLSPIMIFVLTINMLVNYGIITQQDSWHFSNAAWYGSTFVRCASLPYLYLSQNIFKNNKIKFLSFVCVCIMLFSKASQALPAVTIISLSYLLVYYRKFIFSCIKHLIRKNNNLFFTILLSFIFLCLIMSLELYSKLNQDLVNYINGEIIIYFKSPLVILSLIFNIIYYFKTDNMKIKAFLLMLSMMHILIFVPGINYIFVKTSIYKFVAGRTITLLSYSLVLTAGICMYDLLCKLKIDCKRIISLYIVIGLLPCMLFSYNWRKNVGIKQTISILSNNIYLIPDSTKALSDYLDTIDSLDNEPISVISPLWVNLDSGAHTLGAHLKISATEIVNLSANTRYPIGKKDNEFSSFSSDYNNIFEHYNANPYENKENMEKLLSNFSIDVLIFTNENAKNEVCNNFNYKFINQITGNGINYYIVQLQE